MDVAKSLALGAKLGGFARKFLLAAKQGEVELINQVGIIKQELRTAMFACGVGSVSEWNISHLEGVELL